MRQETNKAAQVERKKVTRIEQSKRATQIMNGMNQDDDQMRRVHQDSNTITPSKEQIKNVKWIILSKSQQVDLLSFLDSRKEAIFRT
jgi:hypothetical protein